MFKVLMRNILSGRPCTTNRDTQSSEPTTNKEKKHDLPQEGWLNVINPAALEVTL